MNRKAFVAAGVFLAVALVFPTIIIHAHSDTDLVNILNQDVDATQLQQIIQTINDENLMLYAIVLVVDVVSVVLFAVFLWIAMKP
jgi:hypothetical protein